MKNVFYYDTPLGRMGIASLGEYVTDVFFARGDSFSPAVCRQTPVIREAYRQLGEYFAARRTRFDVPLALCGTEFQTEVWKALLEIPYGQTRTYAQIAARVGRPAAARAVGMANHRNPVAILVPCHRVIGASGELTGYAAGLDIKRFLLELERRQSH